MAREIKLTLPHVTRLVIEILFILVSTFLLGAAYGSNRAMVVLRTCMATLEETQTTCGIK